MAIHAVSDFSLVVTLTFQQLFPSCISRRISVFLAVAAERLHHVTEIFQVAKLGKQLRQLNRKHIVGNLRCISRFAAKK